MYVKKIFAVLIALTLLPLISHGTEAPVSHQPKHFSKIMVVIFENMSYAEIKNAPTFKKLIEYSGHGFDNNGKLTKLPQAPTQDSAKNGYALFSRYYNNHNGGTVPTRPSQPNYIAMTSGSTQKIFDNDNYDLNTDNLAAELIDAQVSWKIYAENLPDPVANHCFTTPEYPDDDGYHRKHEPFISYLNIQQSYNNCKNIVNSSHLSDDLNNMPAVSFYIPNQINNGHNGSLAERVASANTFLSTMMGTNTKSGELSPNAANAPFQQFMAQGGLLVITFDEPSTTGNPDKTIYTLLAGNTIHSGAYPNQAGQNAPVCYPPLDKQTKYPADKYGAYSQLRCNHYNLLKMIEENWQLRGLHPANTSAGYKYALPLSSGIPGLWNH